MTETLNSRKYITNVKNTIRYHCTKKLSRKGTEIARFAWMLFTFSIVSHVVYSNIFVSTSGWQKSLIYGREIISDVDLTLASPKPTLEQDCYILFLHDQMMLITVLIPYWFKCTYPVGTPLIHGRK